MRLLLFLYIKSMIVGIMISIALSVIALDLGLKGMQWWIVSHVE